ncbi:F20N2.12 [Arabidopsis thaliana]|uniref:Cysteine/Histidine-rich C1 domain family protein n=1 Tax=Arabidopsis thaliana TaxID=3702 RepID=Q9ZWD7_ARATH|eukprot:NP_175966.1 Cysteine/Histidine-rich C1 domain family protein [Arabidopsis thaliana]
MEEITLKLSSRAILVCRQSDPSQSTHLLSRRYGGQRMSKCLICRTKKHHRTKYHLHCDTCDYDIHKSCYLLPRCRSMPLTRPHTLREGNDYHSSCDTCGDEVSENDRSYHCPTCEMCYHKVCNLYPHEIRHPFHAQHPLKLTFSSDSSFTDLKELPASWQEEPSDSETEDSDASDDVSSDSSISDDVSSDSSISDLKCKCCQTNLQEVYYHCSICKFNLNLTCARNPPLSTISHLKSHEHPLSIFPRRIPLPCDACGLSLENTNDYVYACLSCNLMVHMACIFLPRVIKITRHQHRLSLSPSLPSGIYPCGVCRLTIDVTYGQFSCNRGCHYAVHSKCAIEERIWDGKDLDGVPEEPDEDVEPFERIDDKTIQHFSHEHYLRLNIRNGVFDADSFCQACIIPILESESFYGCTQCSFLLHEACASFPRKKDHPLHKHRLILHPIPPKPLEVHMRMMGGKLYSRNVKGMFNCSGCDQLGFGFMYICSEKGCRFQLDARCASLPDPFIHGSHSHELFFNLTKGECMGCESSHCSPYSLECMECKSFLGLKCATLPSMTHYKHDKHPLALCYGEEDTTNAQYWCDICEAKLDAEEWFYTCNDYCNVTVHVSCLLGNPIFLKPTSFYIKQKRSTVSVIRNNDNTRAICYRCDRRSTQPFFFRYSDLVSSCSFNCLWDRVLKII